MEDRDNNRVSMLRAYLAAVGQTLPLLDPKLVEKEANREEHFVPLRYSGRVILIPQGKYIFALLAIR